MSINSMFVKESFNNKESIRRLEKKIDTLSKNLEKVNNKIDLIIEILNVDVKEKCDKMGEHIDFIENVYDNVKNPLGYLCNKLNSFTGENQYSLEDFESDGEDESFSIDEDEDYVDRRECEDYADKGKTVVV
jgi:division protein CdvB (Snf7/Vps24/ESCRT-III family)